MTSTTASGAYEAMADPWQQHTQRMNESAPRGVLGSCDAAERVLERADWDVLPAPT
jgi:hypothetical protein